MSERLSPPSRFNGISGQTLRWIGLFCLIAGIVERTFLEQKILGLTDASFQEMLDVLNSSDAYFKIATGAIILMLIHTCALPLFTFLMVEGMKHTKNLRNYFLRVLAVAVVSEIPYDLAFQGKWLDLSVQNPVFALVVAMIMIFLFKSYAGKGVKTVFVSILSVILALLWVRMLGVFDGVLIVVLAAVLWFTRKRKAVQVFAGAVVCCVDPNMDFMRLMFAPLTFLLIHFYNEEPGERNRIVNYCAYPFLLLAGWVLAKFAF